MGRLVSEPAVQPELTRAEYLRLLQAARALEKERAYLLVKVFALLGIRVGELPQVTVEQVKAGRLLLRGSGVRQLAEQSYERMLDTEQLAAGWAGG